MDAHTWPRRTPAHRGDAAILLWDGRIDNRAELRAGLGPVVPHDPDDAALAAAVYRRGGVAVLRDIIGDWSLVLHDPARHAIVLASDFMGVRPLYYHVQPDRVRWSTRLDALAAAVGSETIDEQFVAGYLLFGRCPNRTPYTGIHSVPPGSAVVVASRETDATAITASDDGLEIVPFWTAPVRATLSYTDERDYAEQFTALFREAVAVRLPDREPVVAELSGGLDSSSIVCLADALIREGRPAAPRLHTISYVHRASADVPYIRAVEAHCGIAGLHFSTHEHPLVSSADVGTGAPEGWGPLHRAVGAAARRLGARVILTGQGGDLLTGNWFDDSLQVAASVRRGALSTACREAFAWSRVLRRPAVGILSRAVAAALPAAIAPRAVYAREALSVGADASLTPALRARLADPSALLSSAWRHAPPERRKHWLALTLMREMRLLQRYDAAGIDYAHPFAHRPLVEFLMAVPADVLCRPGEPRRLMRRALAPFWPAALRGRRSKSLFGAPWIEGLRPLAVDLLQTPRWLVVDRGWIDRASLAGRLTRLTHGLACNEPQLRQIVLLEYWLRHRARHRHPAMARRTA
jgi:asparagine synthase (glutamine-hydrolysing)